MKISSSLIIGISLSLISSQVFSEVVPTIRIMPLGDSITSGPVAGMPNDGGYRNDLLNLLVSSGYNVDFVGTLNDSNNPDLTDTDHQALPGIVVDDARELLAVSMNSIDAPDAILIHLGTNDFSAGASVDQVLHRIQKLVKETARIAPHAHVFVANLIPRSDSLSLSDSQKEFARSLPALIEDLKLQGLLIQHVDTLNALSSEDLIDGIHPNSVGRLKLAWSWKNAIEQIFEPNGSILPPQVSAIQVADSLRSITLDFNKPIDPTSVTPQNFTIYPGLDISTAEVDSSNSRVVTLTTNAVDDGTVYRLSCSGIRDLLSSPLEVDPTRNYAFSSCGLSNGSFESGLDTWSVSGSAEVRSAVSYPYAKASEEDFFLVFGGGDLPSGASVSQTIATRPGIRYRLSVNVGVAGGIAGSQKILLRAVGSNELVRHEELMVKEKRENFLWRRVDVEFDADSEATTLSFTDVSEQTASIDLILDAASLDLDEPPASVDYSAVLNSSFESGVINSSGGTYQIQQWDVSPGVIGVDERTIEHAMADGRRCAAFQMPISLDSSASEISTQFKATPGEAYLMEYSVAILGNEPASRSVRISIEDLSGETIWNESITTRASDFVWRSNSLSFIPKGDQVNLRIRDITPVTEFTDTDSSILLLDDIRIVRRNTISLDVTTNTIEPISIGLHPRDLLDQSFLLTGSSAQYTESSIVNLLAPLSIGKQVFKHWIKNRDVIAENPELLIRIAENTNLEAVYEENQAPVANNDSYVVEAGTNLSVVTQDGLLANDSDPEAQALSAVLVSSPTNGSLLLESDGSFEYVANEGFVGVDSFAYRVSDGIDESMDLATVSFNVIGKSGGLLENGGFEVGVSSKIPGWEILSGRPIGLSSLDGEATYIPSDGDRMLVFNAGIDVHVDTISQEFLTEPEETYLFEMNLGITGIAGRVQRLRITINTGDLTHEWTETIVANSPSESTWTKISRQFSSKSNEATLTFVDASDGSINSNQSDLLIDGVQIFKAPQRTLTVNSSPFDKLEIGFTEFFSERYEQLLTPFSKSVRDGDQIKLTAPELIGSFVFTEWRFGDGKISKQQSIGLSISRDLAIEAVYAENEAPVALNDIYWIESGMALDVSAEYGVLSNDSDPNEQSISSILVDDNETSGINLKNDGSFRFDPIDLPHQRFIFGYRADDGQLLSETADLIIQVLPRTGGLVTNAGFEVGLPVDFGSIEGWTVESGNPFGYTTSSDLYATYQAFEGRRQLIFNGGDDTFEDSISQIIQTSPNTWYRLSYMVGITGEPARTQMLEAAITSNTTRKWNASIASEGPSTSYWQEMIHLFQADNDEAILKFTDRSSLTGNAANSDLLLDNIRITPIQPNGDYELWLAEYGLIKDIGDDPDEDNIPSIIEYVNGTDPTEMNSLADPPLMRITNVDSSDMSTTEKHLMIQYTVSSRAARNTNLIIQPEWAHDLKGQWIDALTTDGVIVTEKSDEGGRMSTKLYLDSSFLNNGKIFVRLKLSIHE